MLFYFFIMLYLKGNNRNNLNIYWIFRCVCWLKDDIYINDNLGEIELYFYSLSLFLEHKG